MSTQRDPADIELVRTKSSDEFIGFAIHHGSSRVGTVALHVPTRSIRWNVTAVTDSVLAASAIDEVLRHAFTELSWPRVEARILSTDDVSLRIASIAGMRREGVLRAGPTGVDDVMLARLADDPASRSRDGFISILNAGLPRKRVISQGLIRDQHGRYLLCELTYKKEWDLPGGVVEPGEPPGVGLIREIAEELGYVAELGDLITVNWLPPWRGWDDACSFLFDLGTLDADEIEPMVLQKSEIRAVHWCDLDEVRSNATAVTVELLEAFEKGNLPTYRESGDSSSQA